MIGAVPVFRYFITTKTEKATGYANAHRLSEVRYGKLPGPHGEFRIQQGVVEVAVQHVPVECGIGEQRAVFKLPRHMIRMGDNAGLGKAVLSQNACLFRRVIERVGSLRKIRAVVQRVDG